MRFSDYYNGPFRADLTNVVTARPALHDHGPGEVTIQPRTVSAENVVVRRWTNQHRFAFAAGLFITVLSDQVCYTHFRDSYPAFRALTQYPKWRGDCPGACWYHIHPSVVFRAVGAPDGRTRSSVDLRGVDIPADLLETLEAEVKSFVRSYLPGVDPVGFWARCYAEFPVELRMHHADPQTLLLD